MVMYNLSAMYSVSIVFIRILELWVRFRREMKRAPGLVSRHDIFEVATTLSWLHYQKHVIDILYLNIVLREHQE